MNHELPGLSAGSFLLSIQASEQRLKQRCCPSTFSFEVLFSLHSLQGLSVKFAVQGEVTSEAEWPFPVTCKGYNLPQLIRSPDQCDTGQGKAFLLFCQVQIPVAGKHLTSLKIFLYKTMCE